MSRSQPFRLPSGGSIDRAQEFKFRCNGIEYVGHAGDTLASALLANGVRVVGRSFKFHRPRGVFAAGIEETNALFRVDAPGWSLPLVRATQQPLFEGLSAETENAWPSVRFDVGRVLDFTHRLWPAGFYNKTFMWPNWHWYERAIRHSAGAGRLPAGEDTGNYFQHNLHCEVLVIGGGVAGLAAARVAGRSGARVVVAELEARLGGRLLADGSSIEGKPAAQWIADATAELRQLSNVRLMTSTMIAGAFDHQTFLGVDRSMALGAGPPTERLWKLRARQVVLASGAIEQPLVFAHNDRPGVMLAGAVRRYVQDYAVAAGRNVLVATNNDDAYSTAFALQSAGVGIAAIVDARTAPSPAVLAEVERRGLRILPESAVAEVEGRRGVRAARVARLAPDGRSTIDRGASIECDAVAMSGGWNPTVHLFTQARGTLRYCETRACFVPAGDLAGWHAAGAANGTFELEPAIAQGSEAGAAAARACGHAIESDAVHVDRELATISPVRRVPSGDSSRQWLDHRHDVTVADVELAVRENFVSVEHVKRYTTSGMSIDQGKTSNLNTIGLLAELTHRGVGETGTTTFRPMYSPVSMGAIAAGQERTLYSPTRRLPAHGWHLQAGAVMEEYGGWQRPACYPRQGETHDAAIAREVRAVRSGAGIFDASPLGKIEVRGPDAAEFLHRIYMNDMRSLAPGRVRYGFMLNENGIVLDDGVCACIAPGHYLVGPTSGNADRIASWLDEWHQCEWPNLRLVISPVTTQWAVCNVAGPHARNVLESIDCGIDFAPHALKHLGFAQGRWKGQPVRVQRVSFSGEASYEISVPARCGEEFFDHVANAGRAFGLTPFGVEALLLLRMEKGFLHVGVDTDGTTNPFDLGLGGVVARKLGDFVGRRSLDRANDRRDDRRQFVGLEPLRPEDRLIAGAHVVERRNGSRRSIGFVTSACLSPTLGRSIGLGLVERGFALKGQVVTVFDAGREFEARVVAPGFYDPAGERLHA